MYRERLLSDRLVRLSSTFPVVVVSGARQVGKTTLPRHVFPQHDYVVFDASLDRENARREPELFLKNHPSPVILDEIQYAPEVVSAIKRQVDRNRGAPGQFLLTGSLQWQVLRALAAQEINFSRLGREIGMTPQTARRWLKAMEATFQWFELPAFSGNPTKLICAIDEPHWIADDAFALPWNLLG